MLIKYLLISLLLFPIIGHAELNLSDDAMVRIVRMCAVEAQEMEYLVELRNGNIPLAAVVDKTLSSTQKYNVKAVSPLDTMTVFYILMVATMVYSDPYITKQDVFLATMDNCHDRVLTELIKADMLK